MELQEESFESFESLHAFSFDQKLDKLQGVSASVSRTLQHDLGVQDTVGSLFSFLCIHDDYLDRILEKHIPVPKRTHFVQDLTEKLTSARAEMYVEEFLPSQHADKPRTAAARKTRKGFVSKLRSKTKSNGEQRIGERRGAMYLENDRKLHLLWRVLPTTIRAAGITVGKFSSEEKRRAAFCAEDDGSLQGGFLCAVRGSKYKLHAEVATGTEASQDLVALLNKYQGSVNKYPDRRAFFKALAESSIGACEIRKKLDEEKRTFIMLADIHAALQKM